MPKRIGAASDAGKVSGATVVVPAFDRAYDGLAGGFLEEITDREYELKEGASKAYKEAAVRCFWETLRCEFLVRIDQLGLNQAEAAKVLGVDETSISRFTSGQRNLSDYNLVNMIDKFELFAFHDRIPRHVEGFCAAWSFVIFETEQRDALPGREQYWCLHHVFQEAGWLPKRRRNQISEIDAMICDVISKTSKIMGVSLSLSDPRDLFCLIDDLGKSFLLTECLLITGTSCWREKKGCGR